MDLYRSVSLDRSVIELPEELAVAIGVRGGGVYQRTTCSIFFLHTIKLFLHIAVSKFLI